MYQLLLMLANYCYLFVLHICKGNSFPKPLSAKEENEYLIKAKNGDIKARNKLVEHNLRLVAHIIKKYYATSADHDDLVSWVFYVMFFDIKENCKKLMEVIQ